MKLTPTMMEGLRTIGGCYGASGVNFQTGEALRRRGLADRYTIHVIKAEYVSRDCSTDQGWCSKRKPSQRHEWYITDAGRAALAGE